MPVGATLELAASNAGPDPTKVPIAEFVENVDTGEVIEGEWVDEPEDAAS
jgi:hypothetical protein